MNERIYSSACINQLNNLVYQLLCCLFRFQVFKKRKRKRKKVFLTTRQIIFMQSFVN